MFMDDYNDVDNNNRRWRMQSDNIDSHYPLGLGQVS
jgi:hypothetical protein